MANKLRKKAVFCMSGDWATPGFVQKIITHDQMSSVQNPSIIPLYGLVYRDSPFLDYCNPQYIKRR